MLYGNYLVMKYSIYSYCAIQDIDYVENYFILKKHLL